MVDVHCHLNFHAFKKDADEVIKKAFEDGVTTIINTGTSIESSEKAVELATEYENLYAIVGIHPHHSDKIERDFIEQLEKLVLRSRISPRETKEPKVVGIGEIGIDYYNYKSNGIVDPKIQKEVFVKQVEMAIKLKLPLQIHNRQAGGDITDILEGYKSELLEIPGMFHCMSGNIEHLKKVLDLGFYVGFDGNITYDGIAAGEDTALSELVKYAPIDRIVTETDAPFLTPVPHRGSRNVPSYVIITGEFIAKIKGLTFDELEKETTRNAKKIFLL